MEILKFIEDREIYDQVICKIVPETQQTLWIATADLKDMYVGYGLGKMVPFLCLLSNLIKRDVKVRLIHAKEPGIRFREDFDKYPALFEGLQRVLCPRVHFKCIIVDGKITYFCSANLTGAGMGAKSATRRNFENGILTNNERLVAAMAEQFDQVWRGAHCNTCKRRKYCSDCPLD